MSKHTCVWSNDPGQVHQLKKHTFFLGWVVLRSRSREKVLGSLIMAIHLTIFLDTILSDMQWVLAHLLYSITFFFSFFQFDSKLVEERDMICFHPHIPTFIPCLKLVISIDVLHKAKLVSMTEELP